MLNRIKQARKVTTALNSLLLSKDIVVNTKTTVFCTVTESILSYSWGMWTLVYKLKKKLFSTETDFGKRAARTSRQMKVRKEVIRERMQVTQTIVERVESNMLKCYGRVAGTEKNRRPTVVGRTMAGSTP